MLVNQTKAKLERGEPVFGCFIRYAEPSLAEFAALLGWDFLVFDAEHGTLQPRDVEDLCRAVEPYGTTALVRATTNRPEVILRFLDTGAGGVHVPWVNSPAEAEAAVRSVKYWPRGERGLAGTRASRWGLREPLAAYVDDANRETLVVIHIETGEAVDAIEAYAAIDGVDVLYLGPTDLSQSLGHPGDASHPDVVAALERAAAAIVKSGKALGIWAASEAATAEWLGRGATYFATGLEPLLRGAMTGHLERARAAPARGGQR